MKEYIIITIAIACAYYNWRGTSSDDINNDTPEVENTEKNVFEKGFVTESVNWKDVVAGFANYQQSLTQRDVTQPVLAYVTPWNNHGYDVAKNMGGRFTHVSPVWLQIKRQNNANVITGTHDIDQGWVSDVRKAGAAVNVKVVPRIIFDGWQPSDYGALIQDKKEIKKLINDIVAILKEFKLDGVVVEVWSQLPAQYLLPKMPQVLSEIAEGIRKLGYTFILVIPPPVYNRNIPGSFTAEHFNVLVDSVDAFSLMTYDFSSFQAPGPNSPLSWVKKCVELLAPSNAAHRAKILVGLNLYGLDHSMSGGSHIFGQRYIDVLSKYKPKFQYDKQFSEHIFQYKSGNDRRTVYYPTLYSIDRRIKLAQDLGTGISLWEIGQGLDYFYDLL